MWEQIRFNRRRSVFVITGMGVLLIAMGMALGMLLIGSEGGMIGGGIIAFGLWLVMWLVTVSNGDNVLLQIAGAREIQHKDHPQLFNIVEEMTIAAALPKQPKVFIVDDPSPNAFATGRKPENAGVSVTTGLLRMLDRDELQGVVAHEIGHIKNRDVALMTTAGIMVGCIVLLAEIGIRALWWGGGARRSRSSNDQGGGQAVLMIVAVLLLILAPILSQLIYFALSRKREYLADASGAMFTRYPEGLASALEKLGGSQLPQADDSRVTAPMYIVHPLKEGEKRSITSAFTTHPPLADRVRVLRTMAGGSGLDAYETAFRQVKKKGVIGARTLGDAQSFGIRKAVEKDASTTTQRRRQASDAFLTASGYQKVDCGECGATLKIPPQMVSRIKTCPRCKTAL